MHSSRELMPKILPLNSLCFPTVHSFCSLLCIVLHLSLLLYPGDAPPRQAVRYIRRDPAGFVSVSLDTTSGVENADCRKQMRFWLREGFIRP